MDKRQNALFHPTEPAAGSAHAQHCTECQWHRAVAGGTGRCTLPGGPCDRFLAGSGAAMRGEESRPGMSTAYGHLPEFTNEKPLSVREQKLRAELEQQIIGTVGKAFVVIGQALKTIREQRLYRTTHRNFEAYTKDICDMARRTADQYIDAFTVVENVRHGARINCIGAEMAAENERNCAETVNQTVNTEAPTLPLPANEAQARVLAKLTPEEQITAWKAAVMTAPDGKISAAHIRRTVKDLKMAPVRKAVRTARRATAAPGRSDRISPAFRAAYDAMFEQVRAEGEEGWKRTDRRLVLRFLRALYTAVENYGE